MPKRRTLDALTAVLTRMPERVIACSGGVDSLLLADVAHELRPETTIVAHSVSPAVPPSATDRVLHAARELGWRLELVESREFQDPAYLQNPRNRCYFCKSHLYTELERISSSPIDGTEDWTVMSGANVDDLGEYRPGLIAAGEHRVRHPYIEAVIGKAEIRQLARERGRAWHALPASPCLASRLYTGTAVRADLLRAVDRGEQALRGATQLAVVRCRVSGDDVIVEVAAEARDKVTPATLSAVLAVMKQEASQLRSIALDQAPYAPGRAFLELTAISRSGD